MDSPLPPKSLLRSILRSNVPTAIIRVFTKNDQIPIGEGSMPRLPTLKTNSKSHLNFRFTHTEADGTIHSNHYHLSDLKEVLARYEDIKRLNLEIPDDPMIAVHCMEALFSAVSVFTHFEGLHITFNCLLRPDENNFKHLQEIFENCVRLKELRITYLTCGKIFKPENAACFEAGLYRLTNLESFVLEYIKPEAISNDYLSNIIISASGISDLKKLVIKLDTSSIINDHLFTNIYKSGIRFKNLNVFDLELSHCPNITSKGFIALAQAIAPMKELTRLRLSFQSLEGFNDTVWHGFTKELKLFQKVTTLSLEIVDCQEMTIQGFYAMRDMLVNFNDIRVLTIKISHMELVVHSLAAIWGAIAVYKRMQTLNLDLSYCTRMNEKSLIILRDTITSMKTIRFLKLKLDGWTDVLTDKGMIVFRECIKGMSSLKKIYISLADCTKISDKGFGVFSDIFDHLFELGELSIILRGCKDLTEIGWEPITRGLSKTGGLTKLVLDVTHCDKLVETFCSGVQLAVERNRSLEHLEVYTCGTYEMTDLGMAQLKDAILFMPKAKVIKLVYNDLKNALFRIDKLRTIFERKMKGVDINISNETPY